MLMTFEDVPPAVATARELHRRIAGYNAEGPPDAAILLRVGVHLTDMVIDSDDAYGAGVNLAARLMALAAPGDIVVSDEIRERMVPGLDAETEDLGDCWLKHVKEPVRAHRLGAQAVAPYMPNLEGPAGLRPTVAVLPFSAGVSPAGNSLGDLLADELICALSQLPELAVVSRLSTSALAVRGGTVQEIGTVLQADYVLSGTCHAIGRRLLVHAQLIDSRDSAVVCSFRQTATVNSLVAERSPLVEALIEQLSAAILDRQIALARRCALPNLAGYTLLLAGISMMHRLSRRDFERARELLEHLGERWPRLAAPHAWRARWHMFSVMQGWSAAPDADRKLSFELSQRALDLDPESSVAMTVAGSVRVGLARDVDGGVSLYESALRANPNDSLAWLLLGTAHAFRGDGPQAVGASSQAIRLSPIDPLRFMYDCHAAGAALAAEAYPRARDLAQQSLKRNAQHLSTFRVLAIAQSLLGETEAARGTVQRLLALDPRQSVDGYLRASPSAAYPIGRKFAQALADAGLPQAAA